MKKVIWGKCVLALSLAAAIFAENTFSSAAMASENDDACLNNSVEVSDGNAALSEESEGVVDSATESEEDTAAEGYDIDEALEVSDGNAEAARKKSSEQDSPVFDYEACVDGYKIILHAEEGVIPAGTEAVVERVTKVDGKETDDLVNDVLPAESVVYDSASFDISLIHNGEEIEPDGSVSVDIVLDSELAEANSNNESTDLQVFHIDDNAKTTEISADVSQGSEGLDDYSLNSTDGDATDFYENAEETVVHYEADSFSVYDVSVVLNFTTTEAKAAINPVYEGIIEVDEKELNALGSSLDPTINVKTLLSSKGKCTSTQEIGEAARKAVMARQTPITIDFKLPGIQNEVTIVNEMFNVMTEHTGVANEGDYVRWAFCEFADKETLSFVDDMTYGTVQLNLTYTHNAQQETETTNAINNLVNSLKLTSLKTDYDKAKKAYDWICNNITYDFDYQTKEKARDFSPYSCYSAAVKHYTVCEGYSLLFYRMMLMCGVDARLISGLGGPSNSPGAHGWNIVKIGNIYYNLDSTWGAQFSDKYIWFLKGSRNFDSVPVSINGRKVTYVHKRYDECNTLEFNRVYPTSTTNYANANYNSAAVTVTLNTANATIGVGGSVKLSANVTPQAKGQGVIWSSSDEAVATVTSDGTVSGKKNGECEIFATSVYGGKKARCRVLVTDGRVKSIEAASDSIKLYEGSKADANASVFPEWATNKAIKYKSSNKKVASVNKNGVITGKKKGKCYITCTSADGGYKKKIKVVVKKAVRVKSIKFKKKKIKLGVGGTYTLGVKFNPKKATNKELTWKSNKPGIVSVDSAGNITALSPGKAKITAKSVDGKHKATCTVIVN